MQDVANVERVIIEDASRMCVHMGVPNNVQCVPELTVSSLHSVMARNPKLQAGVLVNFNVTMFEEEGTFQECCCF